MDLSKLWLIAGAVLCLMELFLPTAFVAFMMGLAAIATAIFALLIPVPALQVALWLVSSVVFIYISRSFAPRRHWHSLDASEATTITAIAPGQTGRVIYEGNSWKAKCADRDMAIAPNETVVVVSKEGTTLIVLPEHLLPS
jgi:membrane protein implicated in regulation of membrane protease activity